MDHLDGIDLTAFARGIRYGINGSRAAGQAKAQSSELSQATRPRPGQALANETGTVRSGPAITRMVARQGAEHPL